MGVIRGKAWQIWFGETQVQYAVGSSSTCWTWCSPLVSSPYTMK